MINQEFQKVKEFHLAFGHPTSETPVQMESKDVRIRSMFMMEEILEFTMAEDIYEQADAMIDLLYFTLGTLVEMGLPPEDLFTIVHNANMNKIWSDGQVRVDPKTRKVIKPPEWEDPYNKLQKAIDKMKEES